MGDSCLESLGELLSYQESIEEVTLSTRQQYQDQGGKITDAGLELFAEKIIGNIALKRIDFSSHMSITHNSKSALTDLARKTCLERINLDGTSLSSSDKNEIQRLLATPSIEREIPVFSTSKSAAKSYKIY